ncbi:MAG: MerR family DNA-binding transcriptional regulator [Candidatus Omnitrophica bacterium CG11_big_fil_rev_8_21_14_0_20_45_26]|uniref:MerR family DNA-binding transcriptional regulator n=1 Tax=Candidatus Abzuiibacterium crystallinum TaxID=1974748 RepID=A0A2H0LS48_9BACT|nr:MAG: MerR family DNA-binding transcriptional regulator [Candidatus Omnitrophica bacterium CG11_big_fil_rev_8_21_14_0_20_45_26]PIW64816.1 MAG: MerR family DNA-binding transcriptional regulator [Candidatus Omnitrophica bacterium CG12_big_fil_rev_8_21_14_0_65_45_16]
MKQKKRLYSLDAAKALGVSRRTLMNWEKAGKIPKPSRDQMSNYRIYSIKDVKKLKKITGRPL